MAVAPATVCTFKLPRQAFHPDSSDSNSAGWLDIYLKFHKEEDGRKEVDGPTVLSSETVATASVRLSQFGLGTSTHVVPLQRVNSSTHAEGAPKNRDNGSTRSNGGLDDKSGVTDVTLRVTDVTLRVTLDGEADWVKFFRLH
jgi:hypothetical protein